MNAFRLMTLIAVLCPAFAVSSVATATQPDEEPPVLEMTKKIRGNRAPSPLEQSLEEVIRKGLMQGTEDGDDGGFETEEEIDTPDAPSAEDARFQALQEYVAKHNALENVQATLYFLTTNPDNPNNTKVEQLLTSQSRRLTPQQQTDLQTYQSQRDSIKGGAPKAMARDMEKWADRNASNTFADLAKREATYYKDVDANNKAEKNQKRSRLLVRVGVVVLVLLLVGVVLLGGAA